METGRVLRVLATVLAMGSVVAMVLVTGAVADTAAQDSEMELAED